MNKARTGGLYPVDLIGLAGLTILGLAVFVGLYEPQRAAAEQSQQLRATLARERQKVQQGQQRIRTARRQLDQLNAAIANQKHQPPAVDQLNDVQSGIVAAAQSSGLTIQSVVPREIRRLAECLASELELRAQGPPAAFVQLLDRLAREYPHHALRGFELRELRSDGKGLCEIVVRLQLFLLPEESDAVAAAPVEESPV